MKMIRVVLGCLLIAGTVHAAARTWTSITGSEIEAEFLGEKYGQVTLKTPEGKLMRINLKSLSYGDQQFIKQLQSGEAPASDAKSAPAGPVVSVESKEANLLPYLKGEEWIQIWDGRRKLNARKGKGATRQSHAIYEGRKYRAVIDERGFLYVQPMNNGEKVGFPIRVKPYCWKAEEDGTLIKAEDGKGKVVRRLEKFIDPPAPSRNPDKVHLKGVREDNVSWEMIYEFSPDSLTVQGWVEDTQSQFSQYFNSFAIPPSHEFEPTTSVVEQKKATANCKLTFSMRGKDSKSYGYASSEDIDSPMTTAQIIGHYQPLTVQFDVVESDKWAHVVNYVGVALYNGFNVKAGRGGAGGWDEGNGRREKKKKGKKASSRVKRWDKPPKIKITIR